MVGSYKSGCEKRASVATRNAAFGLVQAIGYPAVRAGSRPDRESALSECIGSPAIVPIPGCSSNSAMPNDEAKPGDVPYGAQVKRICASTFALICDFPHGEHVAFEDELQIA